MENHVHQKVGQCRACGHFGADCTGTLDGDIENDPVRLLVIASDAQQAYWDALLSLECRLGIDIEDPGELAGLTVADVVASFGPEGLGGVDE